MHRCSSLPKDDDASLFVVAGGRLSINQRMEVGGEIGRRNRKNVEVYLGGVFLNQFELATVFSNTIINLAF